MSRVVIEATDGVRGRLGGGKYVTNRYHDISRTKTVIVKHDSFHSYDTTLGKETWSQIFLICGVMRNDYSFILSSHYNGQFH